MKLQSTVFVIVLLFCFAARGAEPAQITIEDYNKVVIGSKLQFVYECLGKQTSISYHDSFHKTLKWEGADFTVVIRLKNNRVIEKWQSGLFDEPD